MIAANPIPRLALLLACLGVLSPARAGGLAPGDYRFELEAGGRDRSYLVHVPPPAASGALPVVLSLHGGGGNARQHRRSTGMDAAADRDGYIAVYPNGSGRLGDLFLTWNAGICCGYAQAQDVDDVGFISALLDDLGRRAAIDPRRIYAAGHSNGGMMAHRLGDELSGRIAAIASVAGARVPTSRGGRAVPVLQIHSEDDPRALYHGGAGPPVSFPRPPRRAPPGGAGPGAQPPGGGRPARGVSGGAGPAVSVHAHARAASVGGGDDRRVGAPRRMQRDADRAGVEAGRRPYGAAARPRELQGRSRSRAVAAHRCGTRLAGRGIEPRGVARAADAGDRCEYRDLEVLLEVFGKSVAVPGERRVGGFRPAASVRPTRAARFRGRVKRRRAARPASRGARARRAG